MITFVRTVYHPPISNTFLHLATGHPPISNTFLHLATTSLTAIFLSHNKLKLATCHQLAKQDDSRHPYLFFTS
jgi:hypothetical protein